MKKFYIILASLYCCIAYAQKVSIRIIPAEKWRFRFSVLNTQDILIKKPISFLSYDNALYGYSFGDSSCTPLRCFYSLDFIDPPSYEYLSKEENFVFYVNSKIANLSGDSNLSLSSPCGYTNEITSIPYIISTNSTIASKTIDHWRIPWNDIWNQIPDGDKAKLEECGELDLRWKCGDLVSDPLPLWVGSLDGATNNPFATHAH